MTSSVCARSGSRRARSAPRWLTAAAGLAVMGVVATACGGTASESEPSATVESTSSPTAVVEEPLAPPPPAVTVASAPAANRAVATLNSLAVKGRAPKTGYDRALFGQTWSDDVNVEGGHNGCDTRNDILRRDLTDLTVRPGTRGCVVTSGTLDDPYTGTTIRFVRGQDTSSAVQVDHVVALSDAWQKGAQQLSTAERTDFANDPRNLQAVDGPTNQQKGDGDAATWLPPARGYRCTYVTRQVEVKAAYRLWVTQAEKDAILRVLVGCGAAEPAPTQTRTATATPRAEPTRTTPPARTPAPPPAQTPPAEAPVYYANCSAVRAAGADPIYAGQPGYSTKLDRDRDGVACE